MIYLRLFYEFFKTGLFAVGGGLATLPFLYDISERTGWFTHADLADMVAVSESTPGPIGVNMATYVGFRTAGIAGALVSTLGLIAPSIIIIIVVASLLRRFSENRFIKGAFYGLRPASAALIASAGISVVLISLFDASTLTAGGSLLDGIKLNAVILALVLALLTNIKPTKKLHPIFYLLASAAIGVIFKF